MLPGSGVWGTYVCGCVLAACLSCAMDARPSARSRTAPPAAGRRSGASTSSAPDGACARNQFGSSITALQVPTRPHGGASTQRSTSAATAPRPPLSPPQPLLESRRRRCLRSYRAVAATAAAASASRSARARCSARYSALAAASAAAAAALTACVWVCRAPAGSAHARICGHAHPSRSCCWARRQGPAARAAVSATTPNRAVRPRAGAARTCGRTP